MMSTRLALALALAVALAATGCRAKPFLDTGPCQDTFEGPALATCSVAGYPDRGYDLVLPDGYNGSAAVPLLLAIHGGGGNKEGAGRSTCADGTVESPTCLHRHAQTHGYAVVFPDGTGSSLIPTSRTWNAGGGLGEWRCVSGQACEDGVDDVAYFRALLDDVESRVAVDTGRVYATGLSNGGAMSHRLACELADRVVAVAPIGGGLQLTTSDPCAPVQPVAVLHVHGTEDPCWRYEGGPPDCPTGQAGKSHVSVAASTADWGQILGCDGTTVSEPLPDAADDGTTTTRVIHGGCAASLEELRVDGGGHCWPDGQQYLPEGLVGRTPRDWGNEVLWEFLSRHAR